MKKYKVFICYKRYSADDLAKRLKEALEDFDIPAFVDFVDIPKKYEFTAKWWEYRDKAVRGCETFAMVVTVGFDRSPEIAKEIKLAREDNKKNFMCFRYSSLKPDLVLKLGNDKVNAKDWEQIEFTEAGELVRKFFEHYPEEKKEMLNAIPMLKKEADVIHLLTPDTISKEKPPPLVRFRITQTIGNTKFKRKLPDVGFSIRNWTANPIRAWVKARVFLGEKDLGLVKGENRAGKYMGYYDGKTQWNLNPYYNFFGHFSVPRECVFTAENLTIEVRVTVQDFEGNEFTFLPVGWTYMRNKNQWFPEPRSFS